MFLVVARHWELIFSLLTNPKGVLDEVEKAMFHVVARDWEHIFFFLTIPKCDLGEVEKTMFQGSHVTLSSFSFSLPFQNAT